MHWRTAVKVTSLTPSGSPIQRITPDLRLQPHQGCSKRGEPARGIGRSRLGCRNPSSDAASAAAPANLGRPALLPGRAQSCRNVTSPDGLRLGRQLVLVTGPQQCLRQPFEVGLGRFSPVPG